MLHIEIYKKVRNYHASNGHTPNTLLISNNLHGELILSAPVSAIGRNIDGAKTYNGMRILIVQNVSDLLQVASIYD
ncbi:hypothetical protein [Acinetobacter phage HFM1]|nr:hypothetical protein [Acinetobacter phage HFM1]